MTLLGTPIQLGYLVPDIQAAIQHWLATMHVGPWFYLPHLALEEFSYYGQLHTLDISLAFSQAGAMQIELIQQHSDTPSMYQEWMMEHRYGLHHFGYGSQDFAADLARLRSAGYVLGQYGRTGNRGPFAYFRTDSWACPGTTVELIDMAHGRAELFASFAAATAAWDGTNPVRLIPAPKETPDA